MKKLTKQKEIEGVNVQVYGYGQDKEIVFEIPRTISGNGLQTFKEQNRQKIEQFTGMKIKTTYPNDTRNFGRSQKNKGGTDVMKVRKVTTEGE